MTDGEHSTSAGASFVVGEWTVEPDRDRIVSGSEKRSLRPQVMRLLVYLHDLNGGVARSEDILRDLWSGKVVSDATLYNCVAELRQSLDQRPAAASYVETIPKVGYRLRVPKTLTARVRNRLGFGGMLIAVAVALSVALTTYLVTAPDTNPGKRGDFRSIAILPFEDHTGHSEHAYLVDGIHDDLLTSVGKIPDLLVISSRSVEPFRGTDKTVAEIGSALAVSSILEGTVRMSGDRIRVSVRLSDTTTEEQVWSESFDAEVSPDNLFELQSDLTSAIATYLAATLESAKLNRDAFADNLEAYNSIWLGDQRFNMNNIEGWQHAEIYYRRAVEIDPSYSAAWQRLASSIYAQYGTFEITTEDLREAVDAAQRATELDPSNGLAWTSRATADWLLARAERRVMPVEAITEMYERGTRLAPNDSSAAREYARFLIGEQGRATPAIRQMERAARRDPLNAANHLLLGQIYRIASRFEDAMLATRRAHELQPDDAYALWEIGLIQFQLGNIADSFVWLISALEYEPEDPTGPFMIASVAMSLGCPGLADQWMDIGTDRFGSPPVAVAMRMSRAIHRNDAQAFALAEHVLEDSGELRRISLWNPPQALWVLRDRDIAAGEPEAALRRYQKIFPRMFEADVPAVQVPVIAIDIAYLLQALGQYDRADTFLNTLIEQLHENRKDQGPNMDDLWYEMEARILMGDIDSALALLRAMRDYPWTGAWRYVRLRPTIDPVRDSDEFREFVTATEDLLRDQRRLYDDIISGRTKSTFADADLPSWAMISCDGSLQ